MVSINRVTLVGNLARDPEVRQTQSGPLVNMTVATSENWTDKASGERKSKAEFTRVVVFNDRLGEIAQKYLHKGSKVYLEGKLQTRAWEKDGQRHYATEVVIGRFGGELVLLDRRDVAGEAHEPVQDSGTLDDQIPW